MKPLLRRCTPLKVLSLILVVLAMPVQSSDPVPAELLAPRPYGFVIGDTIPHRIEVEVDAGLELDTGSIPQPGQINYWLELRELDISQTSAGADTRYTIDLVYQTFFAARAVESLVVPGFTIVFNGRGKPVQSIVKPWHFTMSVIRENSVLAAEGREYMRPDDPPVPFDTQGPKIRLMILTGTLTLLLGSGAYWYGYLPFSRRGRVFDTALRKLDGLVPEADTAEGMRTTMGIIHAAFNEIHGRPLFQNALEEFLRDHPGFRRIEPEIDEFFQASNRLFFSSSDQQEPYSPDRAKALCCRCRSIERGLG